MTGSWKDAENFLKKFGTRKDEEDFHSGGEPRREGFLRKLKKTGKMFVAFFIMIFLVLAYISEYLEPWEVGVKQNKSGDQAGFEEIIYPGGYRYMLKPFTQEMYKFDTRLCFLAITTEVVQNEDGSYTITPGTGVEVPTTDGSKVFSDVTIAYRVYPALEYDAGGKMIHGGPNELRKKAGVKKSGWEKVLLQDLADRSKRALGSLKTDDYYNAKLREEKAELAKKLLNEDWVDDEDTVYDGWNKHGIEIVDVLIRAYYYMPVIDKAIASKNLQIQEEKLNSAKEKFAFNNALVEKARAEGDAIKENLRVAKRKEADVIISKGNSYERVKSSDGDLLVEKAKAYSQKLIAESLEAPGFELYVAKELAPLAKNLKGGVIADMDPFNMEQWIERFAGKKSSK